MGYRSHDPLRLSCLLEPLAERRLSYEHHRVAHLYGARSANGPPDTDMILMVLHGGPENPQITHQIRLLVRRHDAAQRRPHVHNPNALTHFKRPLQPVILQKPLNPWGGFDNKVRAKATGIELRIGADQRAQMGERAPASLCMNLRASADKQSAQICGCISSAGLVEWHGR